jgi:hypothetical protein
MLETIEFQIRKQENIAKTSSFTIAKDVDELKEKIAPMKVFPFREDLIKRMEAKAPYLWVAVVSETEPVNERPDPRPIIMFYEINTKLGDFKKSLSIDQ